MMSVYKKEKAEYLRQSIDSILAQSVPTDDFVIVCDGSLSEELDMLLQAYEEQYPVIRLVRLAQNVGLGPALNAGLSYCRHDIVARMDSDDISVRERCEKQLRIFESMQADLVGGSVQEFSHSLEDAGKCRVLPEADDEIRAFSKRRNPFNHPAVMFRKSALQQAGGYRQCPYFEDYDLWVRMLQNGAKGYNIREVILYMRAGQDMYQRRGGLAYVRHMLRFKKHLYRTGYIGAGDFLVSTAPHVAVGMMPNGMRRLFYEKVLRK